MIMPIYLVAGLINLLASNLNFNLNTTTNPNIDLIRVRREYKDDFIPLNPIESKIDHTSAKISQINDIPTVIDIFKNRKRKYHKTKRDTSQQSIYNNQYTSGPYNYNGYNGNVNGYNGNVNGYNGNLNDYYRNENGNNGIVNTYNGNNGYQYGYNGNNVNNNQNHITNNDDLKTNLHTNFKKKPNIFIGTFNAIAGSLGYTTTEIPTRYSVNNVINNNPYYNNGYYNQNTGISATSGTYTTNYPFNVPNIYYNGNNYNNIPTPYNSNQNKYNDRISPYNNLPIPYNNQIVTVYDQNKNSDPTYNNGDNGSRSNDKNRRNGKGTTTEKIINTGCILCSSFGCPENQKRVGFSCREVNYDDDDY